MFFTRILFKFVSAVAIFIVISACTDNAQLSEKALSETTHLTVYKKAQCECCGKWLHYMEDNGFSLVSDSQSQNSLSAIKEKYGIHKNLASCHTSVTDDGYVFEGHIPAKFIKKFLDEKPEGATGLAVPAMPTGTPGMEFGDMLQPYKIYLLKSDGSIEIYAEVNSAEDQI